MPVLERSIEAFRRRHGYTPERARGAAELTIGRAVRDMLAGDMTALDRVPAELYEEARRRYDEGIAAGDAATPRRNGTWGS